jgi:hypothetical protein
LNNLVLFPVIQGNLEILDVRFGFHKECGSDFNSKWQNTFEAFVGDHQLLTTFEVNKSTTLPQFRPISKFSGNQNTILNIFEFLACDDITTSSDLQRLHQNRYFSKANEYFLFIVEPKKIHTFNILHPFLTQIQNKIFVGFSENTFEFFARKLCYFCNEQEMLKTQIVKLQILNISSLLHFYDDIKTIPNFNGKLIRIVCPNVKVRINLIKTKDGSLIPDRGVFGNLLFHLSGKLNYSAQYLKSTGGSTGKKLDNGTWIGVTGDLYREIADVGVLSSPDMNRFALTAFTTAAEYQSLIMITGKHYQHLTWKLLSIALQKSVWEWMTFTLVLAATIFIYTIQKILDCSSFIA